jgi:beta-N-acetylhexosaminidase
MRKPAVRMVLLILLAAVPFCGCGVGGPAATPQAAPTPAVTRTPATPSPSPTPTPSPTPDPAAKKQAAINAMMAGMTTEEMVGQVFMLSCRKDAGGDPVLKASQGFTAMIQSYAMGGVILFSENIGTVAQTVSLISDIQAASTIPLFIAVDEEGGRISRVASNDAMGATRFPPMAHVGATGDTGLAYTVGQVIGEELSSLGFNMDMAPIADVNTNPQNQVIGDRAFSSDPQTAARMVAAFTEGLQSTGVAAVLKHFPGHGDTSADTHKGTVSVSHDMERLRSVELVPFAAGIGAGAIGVMSAHIQAPNVTGSDKPATLSPELLTGLLRMEMGYEGLIITDALEMKAVSGEYTSAEACVMAFLAGADILLMPTSAKEGYQGVLTAVRDGTVSKDRLQASVRRILSAKYDIGLFSPNESTADPEEVLGSSAHRAVAEAVEAGGTGAQ